MKYSASIKFLWAGLPMPERARKAAQNGFDSVEFWDWRVEDMDALHAACRDSGIRIAGFFGHSAGGFRDPALHDIVLEHIAESVQVAQRVGATQLHLFSDGIRRPQGEIVKPPPITQAQQYLACIEGLHKALRLVEGTDITLILEAINTVHVPGYFWGDHGITIQLCQAVNHPQLRLAYDCFHQQLVGGRLTDNLLAALPYAARIDIGDVPGRHQPGTGEINYAHIRRVLEQQGYDGPVTFETVPLDGDDDACVAAIRSTFGF